MASQTSQIKLSPDEVAVQGEAWYERLKSQIEPGNIGRYLVVDVETGEYDIGDDYIFSTERLLQNPSLGLKRLIMQANSLLDIN